MGNKPKINVMFNWVRLWALLHHFAKGTPIPEGWLTNINVVALDDPRCECPEYVKSAPRPSNDNSSSGSSSSRRPSVLNLSPPACNKRTSTSGSPTGNRKRNASGARDVPMAKRVSLSSARDSGHQLDLQLRHRGYSPRDIKVYSSRNVPNARGLAEAGRALPDGKPWTDVREDVQHLLLSGTDFKCAMKWVSESQGIHHLAPRETVCQMLTQVIHARQLDETPWCRFAPEVFFTSAEGTLRLRQAKRDQHLLGILWVGSSDDEVQDPSYELSQAGLNKAARAEAAADNDNSSEVSDGAETESKPAAKDLSPASLREPKTQKTRDKGSGSKSHGSSERFEYRGTKGTKSRVSPKPGGYVKRLRAQYEALLKRLCVIPGFPKTLLYEPGLWTLPVCACH
ncbi:hypothetical protein PHMEG_00021628 [Phytophthora megakarya]|uniref:Eukaryotic/viral aspartic protease n=1 Tax=Phytophthora megakarya TaxID=4795 RepID=A0A225VLC9_9STRA|nr:hypothetical protein PHMEG_00021628 [Phytophthora megakarya]